MKITLNEFQDMFKGRQNERASEVMVDGEMVRVNHCGNSITERFVKGACGCAFCNAKVETIHINPNSKKVAKVKFLGFSLLTPSEKFQNSKIPEILKVYGFDLEWMKVQQIACDYCVKQYERLMKFECRPNIMMQDRGVIPEEIVGMILRGEIRLDVNVTFFTIVRDFIFPEIVGRKFDGSFRGNITNGVHSLVPNFVADGDDPPKPPKIKKENTPKIKKQPGRAYVHLATIPVDDILPTMIELGDKSYNFNQVKVGNDSVRVSTFKNEYRKNKKLACYACGIVADKVTIDVFANQASEQKPHFNFWAGDVLMTHDHQLARSLGGKDVEENARICCTDCNHKKSIPEAKLFDFCKRNKIDPKDLTSGIDWNKLSYQESIERLWQIYNKLSSYASATQTEKSLGELLYDKIYNDVKG